MANTQNGAPAAERWGGCEAGMVSGYYCCATAPLVIRNNPKLRQKLRFVMAAFQSSLDEQLDAYVKELG